MEHLSENCDEILNTLMYLAQKMKSQLNVIYISTREITAHMLQRAKKKGSAMMQNHACIQ